MCHSETASRHTQKKQQQLKKAFKKDNECGGQKATEE